MDTDTEEEIRDEIHQIKAIPVAQRTAALLTRLNDLEAEIRRRHPELQQGKISQHFDLSCCLILWFWSCVFAVSIF